MTPKLKLSEIMKQAVTLIAPVEESGNLIPAELVNKMECDRASLRTGRNI